MPEAPSRTSPDRWDLAFWRLYPPRHPITMVKQAHLPTDGSRPLALPFVGPNLDCALDPLARDQGRAGELDQSALFRIDAAGIPVVRAQPIRPLFASAEGKPPGKTGARDVDPQRLLEVFDAEPRRCIKVWLVRARIGFERIRLSCSHSGLALKI